MVTSQVFGFSWGDVGQTIQYYVGGSVGVQRLKGNRTETASYIPIPDVLPAGIQGLIPFTDEKKISTYNGTFSAHLGFTADIPRTAVFLSPEIYIGRGNNQNNIIESRVDPTFTTRSLFASIRQSAFVGAILQVGMKVKWDLRPYISLGLERSQFEYTGMYVPRSQAALAPVFPQLGPAVDFPPTALKSIQWLSGFVWGLGVEKQYGRVKVGLDARFVKYNKFKQDTLAQTAETETLLTVIKPQNTRIAVKVSYIF